MVDEGPTGVGDPGTVPAKIDIIARALIDLFGDRAREVGEHQENVGETAVSSAIWRQIVERVGWLRG